MDEEHALLASSGTRGNRPDLRCALWVAWPDRRRAGGHLTLGIGLFIAAFLNRVVQSIAVGWEIIGDRRALYLSWLYPVRDFSGFPDLGWQASAAGLFSGAEKPTPSARVEESFPRIARRRARWAQSCKAFSTLLRRDQVSPSNQFAILQRESFASPYHRCDQRGWLAQTSNAMHHAVEAAAAMTAHGGRAARTIRRAKPRPPADRDRDQQGPAARTP